MFRNILQIDQHVLQDEAIINNEKHVYTPYNTTTFNTINEIRIIIEDQDLYTLPSQSSLVFEGNVKTNEGAVTTTSTFINNGISYLFNELRYELGGVVVDHVQDVGISTTMKGLLSFNSNESLKLQNAGWLPLSDLLGNDNKRLEDSLIDEKGNFNICIPLSMLLGFAEDFNKIIVKMKQELILKRSITDDNAIYAKGTELYKVNITKIEWRVPHIKVSDSTETNLLRKLKSKVPFEIAFRRWDLYELPVLQTTKQHVWRVTTTSQIEKPRYVIIGFQKNKKNKLKENMSQFDHCHLRNIKLYLSSEVYPYQDLFLDFEANKWSVLYEMYATFQSSYYGKLNEPVLSRMEFKKKAPLVVIDCSRQNDRLKEGAVDVRLEFETTQDIPDNTTAYCLILHDCLFNYNPFLNTVIKV